MKDALTDRPNKRRSHYSRSHGYTEEANSQATSQVPDSPSDCLEDLEAWLDAYMDDLDQDEMQHRPNCPVDEVDSKEHVESLPTSCFPIALQHRETAPAEHANDKELCPVYSLQSKNESVANSPEDGKLPMSSDDPNDSVAHSNIPLVTADLVSNFPEQCQPHPFTPSPGSLELTLAHCVFISLMFFSLALLELALLQNQDLDHLDAL